VGRCSELSADRAGLLVVHRPTSPLAHHESSRRGQAPSTRKSWPGKAEEYDAGGAIAESVFGCCG
jgi:hypothetical protein